MKKITPKERFKKEYSTYRVLSRLHDYAGNVYYLEFLDKFEKKYMPMYNGIYRTFDLFYSDMYRYDRCFNESTFSFRMDHYKSLRDKRLP